MAQNEGVMSPPLIPPPTIMDLAPHLYKQGQGTPKGRGLSKRETPTAQGSYGERLSSPYPSFYFFFS